MWTVTSVSNTSLGPNTLNERTPDAAIERLRQMRADVAGKVR